MARPAISIRIISRSQNPLAPPRPRRAHPRTSPPPGPREVFLECKPAFRGQYFLFHSGRAEERHRSYRCQHRERLVQVTCSGKTGYIKQDYVSTTGSASNNTSASTGTAAVVKCSSTVNFRSAASTSSTILGELKNGTAITVLSTSNGWSKVSYAGKTGYISADYLVTASSGTAISPSNTATPLLSRSAQSARAC